jgi:hypothetical protein
VRALRRRSKSQPSPARAIYEALSDPIVDQARREWLDLRDGELRPGSFRLYSLHWSSGHPCGPTGQMIRSAYASTEAASCIRPVPTTLPQTSPSSRSGADPSSAASSTNTNK